MKQNVILFVAVAVLAALAGAGVSLLLVDDPNRGPAAKGAAALLGEPRPPFTLGASDGRRVSASDFDGQVLLINFWATWCKPCREEMPLLNDLQAIHGTAGLSIVGIALDDVARARDFAKQLNIGYTILVGGGDVMSTGRIYGNYAGVLPYTVLIGRDGRVRWTHLGELERSEVEQEILKLL